MSLTHDKQLIDALRSVPIDELPAALAEAVLGFETWYDTPQGFAFWRAVREALESK